MKLGYRVRRNARYAADYARLADEVFVLGLGDGRVFSHTAHGASSQDPGFRQHRDGCRCYSDFAEKFATA